MAASAPQGLASDAAYGRMAAALEKLTKEADSLVEHQKLMKKHDVALTQLNKSFDQVQSRLERIAAVKPSNEFLSQ
ncbi:glucose-induced degradation protein 8-like protein [Platysternon megacephalum]|uniref:Glucose-induced degradation protein 8-like protein n=1 Tax=Platysternon megacephalum TaxID=55544 RepID=A0A4D9E7C5_9SAUR|nr:glucose-induced degradation protein 8-like protein [Platysternon megacephalum]